jgi:hypothetical protein
MKIVTVSNKIPTEPYYCWPAFLESLRRFGYTPIVLGMGEPWKGLMTPPRKVREWLRQGNATDEIIIMCDSWDLVFAASPAAIEEEFKNLSSAPLLWNAEKTLWPDVGLKFPDVGTPYRYLNSGFVVGYAGALLEIIEAMDIDSIPDDHTNDAGVRIEPNHQEYFQRFFAEHPDSMTIDRDAVICQALHAVEPEELDMSQEKIQNTITKSYPMVFHMNGTKETWRDKILTKLNLPQ